METKAAGATSNRQYEDFEPFCRWHREEGHDILEIDVTGFKRDQLKVQTNTKMILTIHGENPMDASKHKGSRFHKEITLPKEISADEISAKLSNGMLYVVMPNTVRPWKKTATPILEVKIGKRTAIKVATAAVAVVVTLVAIGTCICSKSSG